VRQLLETERGKTMSSEEIRKLAGVTLSTVTRNRARLESNLSNCKAISESPKRPNPFEGKVITGRGLRPKTYRTRKKREAERQGRINPVPGPIQWPTREERGMVPVQS
jgi:hypothetical protein